MQFQQVAGFAYLVDAAFGDQYTPQIGFDTWFDEGLAVYYETMLQPGVGRLAWPFWHGAFAAGVAGRRMEGGDLSEFNRDAFMGNHYIVGSHFVRYLAQRYGEWPLWQTIAVQARSIFFPLWINLRFWQAYDKTLETLFAEFAEEVARRHPAVARPPEQRMLEKVGAIARYGRAPDGSEALIVQGHDTPPRIVVRGPDGRVRVDRNLIDVAPPRTLVAASADSVGPPSFTADGRFVYFTTLDEGVTFEKSRLVRVDVGSGALTVVNRDIYGGGGSISPDGKTYAFARADGDRHNLVLLDLPSGSLRVLAAQPPGAFVSLPRYAPDGQRIVATVFDGTSFSIRIFDAHSGAVLAEVTGGREAVHDAVHDASWADATHVVYLRSDDREDGFQVYLADLASGQSRQLTHAPYLAFEPQVAGGKLRFLNRDGWRWTLDEQEVSLAAIPAPAAPPAGASAPVPVEASQPALPPTHGGADAAADVRSAGVPSAGHAGLAGLAGLALADRRQPFPAAERRRLPPDRSSVRPANARGRSRRGGTTGDAGRGEPRRRGPLAVPSLGAERALAARRRSARLRRLRRLRERAVRAVLHRRRRAGAAHPRHLAPAFVTADAADAQPGAVRAGKDAAAGQPLHQPAVLRRAGRGGLPHHRRRSTCRADAERAAPPLGRPRSCRPSTQGSRARPTPASGGR